MTRPEKNPCGERGSAEREREREREREGWGGGGGRETRDTARHISRGRGLSEDESHERDRYKGCRACLYGSKRSARPWKKR